MKGDIMRFTKPQQDYQLTRIFLPRAISLLEEVADPDPKLVKDIEAAVERAVARNERKKDPPA
jgi:hypothetical protein